MVSTQTHLDIEVQTVTEDSPNVDGKDLPAKYSVVLVVSDREANFRLALPFDPSTSMDLARLLKTESTAAHKSQEEERFAADGPRD
jgi:hypothetical protein